LPGGEEVTLTVDEFGPIQFLIVRFPAGRIGTAGFKRLLQLVDDHILRILDLEFVTRDQAGNASLVPIEALSLSGDEATLLAQFIGASSGLVDDEDLAFVAANLAPGEVAAILMFEEIAVLSLIKTWESEGVSLLGSDAIAPVDLEATLNALDAAEA